MTTVSNTQSWPRCGKQMVPDTTGAYIHGQSRHFLNSSLSKYTQIVNADVLDSDTALLRVYNKLTSLQGMSSVLLMMTLFNGARENWNHLQVHHKGTG